MAIKTQKDVIIHWNKTAADLLLGYKIVSIEYISQEEADRMYWHSKGLKIVLRKGNNVRAVWVQQDDEGNGPGALYVQPGLKGEQYEILPTI